jgi:hypothetical protein
MHPAILLAAVMKFFLKSAPKSQGSIVDSQGGCYVQTSRFKILEKFFPGKGAFSDAVVNVDEFFLTIFFNANQGQNTRASFVEPNIKINPICPDVYVSTSLQISYSCSQIPFIRVIFAGERPTAFFPRRAERASGKLFVEIPRR